jgi:streptomycin 3"-adenylyltransferase
VDKRIPKELVPLLTKIVGSLETVLDGSLVGIYVHGSIALGSFNYSKSDVDFLVVVRRPLTLQEKRKIIDFTLEADKEAPKKGLEFSIVTEDQVKDLAYPTPFELHYSSDWRKRYENGMVDLEKSMEDADLAAHFAITKFRGICVYGEPIDEVFPDIPQEYYWRSIYEDAESVLENLGKDPVYGILNLCRVMAFKKDRLILSKKEGGEWALKNLEKRFHSLVLKALKSYASGKVGDTEYDQEELEQFTDSMKEELVE